MVNSIGATKARPLHLAEGMMIQGAVWTTDREAEAILGEFRAEDAAADGGAHKGFSQRAVERGWSGADYAIAVACVGR